MMPPSTTTPVSLPGDSSMNTNSIAIGKKYNPEKYS